MKRQTGKSGLFVFEAYSAAGSAEISHGTTLFTNGGQAPPLGQTNDKDKILAANLYCMRDMPTHSHINTHSLKSGRALTLVQLAEPGSTQINNFGTRALEQHRFHELLRLLPVGSCSARGLRNEQLVIEEQEDNVGCIMFEKCITMMICLAHAISVSWLFMWNYHRNRKNMRSRRFQQCSGSSQDGSASGQSCSRQRPCM